MIRRSQAFNPGVVMYALPNTRQRQSRRRMTAMAVIVSIAFAGGLIGQLSTSDASGRPVPPGPFSYFPL